MNNRFTTFLPLLMLAGLALGALCGYLFPELGLAIDFVGRLFMGVLRFVVVPLLVASAITGLALLTEGRSTGKISLVFFSYVLATTVVAVIIAVAVALLFAPGYRFAGAVGNPLTVTWTSVSEALGDIIPANPLRAIAEGKYVGLVLLGGLLGAGLAALGVRGRSVLTLFRGIHDGLLRVVPFVLFAAPIGLFCLVAAAVAREGGSLAQWMATSGGYLSVSIAALAVHGLVVLSLVIWYFTGRLPWSFYSDLSPAFLTAFGTGSKAVTFPVTSQCLVDRTRLDIRATSAVLPLSTALNLSGSAIVMVTGTLFAAQACGIVPSFGSIVALSVLAVILSLGAAGMPSSMLLAAPVLFGVVGLTVEQMALAIPAIAAFDWLVDRIAAVINVGSDGVAAAVVAESLESSTGRRPSRARRTGRDEGDFEQRGRRPQAVRAERRPSISRPERGQPEPVERGRSEFRPGGRPHPAGERPRQRFESADSSPFQMRAGRTPVFGAGPEQSASEPERPDSVRERPERRERRPSQEGPGDRRRASGHPRSRFERPEGEPRALRRPPESPEAPAEAPADTETRRVSREAVAKDLARISAQLGKPPAGDTTPTDGAITDLAEEPVLRPPVVEPESELAQGDEPSVLDEVTEPVSERVLWDDDIDAAGTPDAEEEIAEGETEPDEAGQPTEFGRRRAFRGAAFRRDNSVAADEPKEPVPDDRPQGFSSEDVSFGRAKRKKPRR